MTSPCPSCKASKGPGMYVCPACWAALPAPARRALSRRDSRALARLRELHAQIAAGLPLGEIRVTP